MDNDSQPQKRPRGRPRKPVDPNAPPPRPRGRPSIGDAAKIHNLSIRVNGVEYQLWQRLAAEAGMTLADFIAAPLRRELKRKGIKP